jgi:recombination protein RecT
MTEQNALVPVDETATAQFRAALEPRIGRIEELLPPTMDARRFASVSLIALAKNTDLLRCDRTSFVMAVLEAAEIGLEPTGGVGGAHLVPFKGKIQLILDYRGVQYLIREGGGGEIKTVLVYEGDIFRVYEGTTKPRIHHSPKFMTKEPAKITYVYAVPLDHPEKFEVMTKAEIDGIRGRSKAANNGPWVSDFGAMARKSVLKRISAWLPLKPSARLDAREILDRDTRREIGEFDEDSGEPVRSRTAEVRERVRARSGRRRRETPQDAPSAPETAPPPDGAAPDDSAAQRPEGDAPDDAGVPEGESREVCGANGTGVAEGEVCVLDPGHGGKVHKSAEDRASWPVEPAS